VLSKFYFKDFLKYVSNQGELENTELIKIFVDVGVFSKVKLDINPFFCFNVLYIHFRISKLYSLYTQQQRAKNYRQKASNRQSTQ